MTRLLISPCLSLACLVGVWGLRSLSPSLSSTLLCLRPLSQLRAFGETLPPGTRVLALARSQNTSSEDRTTEKCNQAKSPGVVLAGQREEATRPSPLGSPSQKVRM